MIAVWYCLDDVFEVCLVLALSSGCLSAQVGGERSVKKTAAIGAGEVAAGVLMYAQ